jgi:hypothetical protein
MTLEHLNVNAEMVPHIVVPITRNGACLFNSLSYLMYGTKQLVREVGTLVRQLIVSHVTKIWTIFQHIRYSLKVVKIVKCIIFILFQYTPDTNYVIKRSFTSCARTCYTHSFFFYYLYHMVMHSYFFFKTSFIQCVVQQIITIK